MLKVLNKQNSLVKKNPQSGLLLRIEIFSPNISNALKFIPFNNLYRLFDGRNSIISSAFYNGILINAKKEKIFYSHKAYKLYCSSELSRCIGIFWFLFVPGL